MSAPPPDDAAGRPRTWSRQPNLDRITALFTPAECAAIVAMGDGLEETVDSIQGRVAEVRRSHLKWLKRTDGNGWLFDRLTAAVTDWNDANFRFDIEGEPDLLQLTAYHVGDQYNWHADLGANHTSRRKISVTVLLNPVADFDGGELEFFDTDVNRPRPPLRMGDAVLFPSFMKHRVLPVTAGVRHSLVGWYTGPPFR